MTNAVLGIYIRSRAVLPLIKPRHNSHRRSFFSVRDANAYDAGHQAYTAGANCPDGPSPGWQGWMDAQGADLIACTADLTVETAAPAAAPAL